MWGGFVIVVLVSLVVLSPVIWFVWWMLDDLANAGARPHRVA
ncbi:MAG TPA: hypothetical protein VFL29_01590 [Candidatus Dormibacteraeota bacterium]|nr:hypothetical protein [Candidatus Dormibacteraeota bacterium]